MTKLLSKDALLGSSSDVDPTLLKPINRGRAFTADQGFTFDSFTIDSTGAYFVGELERLDQKLHDPLVTVSWGRDIDLREDVTMGDEFSSFTNSSFASPGGINPAGKAWISKDTNLITGIDLDIGKTMNPLFLWGMEIKYTVPELESAAKTGRPIDTMKYDAMKLKYQMDIDEQVYIGDTTFNKFGLFNSPLVTTTNVVNGAGGSPLWSQKSPDEILADINTLLTNTWAATGYAIMPRELRLPPAAFSYLVSQKVSSAGNISILEFVRNNSMANASNGVPLNIQPVKWLNGLGAGGTNRMVAYTKDYDRVRFPLVPMARTPLEYRSIWQITTYFSRLGVIEFVYPECTGYADGI